MTMIRRKQWALFAAIPGFFALLSVLVLLARSWTAITPENAARVLPGMTQTEVEALLGGPAHDESTGALASGDLDPHVREGEDWDAMRSRLLFTHSLLHLSQEYCDGSLWRSDCAIIYVCFDETRRVTGVDSITVWRDRKHPLAMVKDWLRIP
jgi:hypothetical protein